MERDVHEVIAERVELPEMIFNPKRRVGERIKLRGRARRKPYLAQAFRRMEQDVAGHITVVVPDVARVPDRRVGDERGGDQKQTEKPAAIPRGQPAVSFWKKFFHRRNGSRWHNEEIMLEF